MMLCEALRDRIQAWLRDYDRLQYFAVILLYIQVPSFAFLDDCSLFLMIVNQTRVSLRNPNSRLYSICIDCLRIARIAGSIVQRSVAHQSGDCIVRSGRNRKQQSEPRPNIRRPSRLCYLPRCLLVHSLLSRNMVCAKLLLLLLSSFIYLYLILCLIHCAGFFLPGPIQLSISFQ